MKKTPLTKEKLYKMNRLKTGCLIKCACLFGLYAAENTTSVKESLYADAEKYADGIGVSFQITDDILALAGGAGTNRGTGGMITKLHAAQIATAAGINTVVMNGDDPEDIYKLIDGRQPGTLFKSQR